MPAVVSRQTIHSANRNDREVYGFLVASSTGSPPARVPSRPQTPNGLDLSVRNVVGLGRIAAGNGPDGQRPAVVDVLTDQRDIAVSQSTMRPRSCRLRAVRMPPSCPHGWLQTGPFGFRIVLKLMNPDAPLCHAEPSD